MGSTAADTFGKYELTRRLAFGGMAEIFLAALKGEQGFAKKVVLKRILPQFGGDPEFVRMFIDEAVIAARLTHANIVQVYDFGEIAGVYFIAMEWVDGIDLRALNRHYREAGKQLSLVQVAAIGEGICRGLGYAHNFTDDESGPLHIVHRDVSPHNVMLSRSGEPKVMDFGIAKAEERATHTKTGMIKGKIAYMAPEQAGGYSIDKRSDQFAVSLVLWECLTGLRLFRGETDMELLRKVASGETRPPSSVRSDVPEVFDAIIMRALAREPDDRYPDLSDMERDLTAFRFSFGAEGAVRLGSLVDEVLPRQPTGKTGPHPRLTMPLPEQDTNGSKKGTASVAPSDRPPAPSVSRLNMRRDTEITGERPDPWHGDSSPAVGAKSGSWAARSGKFSGVSTASQALRPGTGQVPAASPREQKKGTPPEPPREMAMARRRNWAIAFVALVATLVVVAAALVAPEFMAAIEAVRANGAPVSDAEKPAPTEPAPPPPPSTGILTIYSEPPGAAISIEGAGTGLRTPAPVPDQTLDQPLQVELTLKGYETIRQAVTLRTPQEEIRISLKKTEPPKPAPPKPAPPKPKPKKSKPAKVKAPKQKDKPPEPPPEPGQLSMRSLGGWVEVYLGKKKLGTTPFNNVEIPAGKHTLRIVNRDRGIRMKKVITVKPGEHLRERIAVE